MVVVALQLLVCTSVYGHMCVYRLYVQHSAIVHHVITQCRTTIAMIVTTNAGSATTIGTVATAVIVMTTYTVVAYISHSTAAHCCNQNAAAATTAATANKQKFNKISNTTY
jgi:hypothetical protein